MRPAGLALLTIVTGCAIARPAQPVSGPPDEPTLEDAYATVRSGKRSIARAEGWVIEWAGEGRIRVVRAQAVEPGAGASDAAITRKLRQQLGAMRLWVRTEAGVVTLRGWLASQADALRAIRAALGEAGVAAVDVELSFPLNQASRR